MFHKKLTRHEASQTAWRNFENIPPLCVFKHALYSKLANSQRSFFILLPSRNTTASITNILFDLSQWRSRLFFSLFDFLFLGIVYLFVRPFTIQVRCFFRCLLSNHRFCFFWRMFLRCFLSVFFGRFFCFFGLFFLRTGLFTWLFLNLILALNIAFWSRCVFIIEHISSVGFSSFWFYFIFFRLFCLLRLFLFFFFTGMIFLIN